MNSRYYLCRLFLFMKLFKYHKLTFFWSMVIMSLCGLPGGVVQKLDLWNLLSFDKIAHAGVYALLGFFALQGLHRQYPQVGWWPKFFLIATSYCACWGALSELLQEYVFIDRFGDWLDFIADVIGSLLGILSYPLWIQSIRPKLIKS